MTLEAGRGAGKEQICRRAGAIDALQALGETVAHDARFVGIYLVGFNLLWVICSLPLITLPPATAALYVVTQRLAKRQHAGVRDFFATMRRYFVVAWRWALLNMIVLLLVSANVWFYSILDQTWSGLAMAVWLGLGVAWLVVDMYCFPLLLEQTQPRVSQALRNALVLCLRHPGFTLVYACVTALLIAVSAAVIYLWVLITGALLAFLGNRSVSYLLRVERGEESPY
jgi:uncharacterized membrane protein YesL